MQHDPRGQGEPWLLEAFLALDTPAGFRAELIESEIVVTPPPRGDHESIVSEISAWVPSKYPGLRVFTTLGLATPGGMFIPDLAVAPKGAFVDRESWHEPGGVLLVAEVTSSRPELDRNAKRRGYAGAGIPLYLLVDRDQDQVTIFSEPHDGDYHHRVTVIMGDKLELPDPVAGTLDTAEFPPD
jgi:Uma2 family endonuclease